MRSEKVLIRVGTKSLRLKKTENQQKRTPVQTAVRPIGVIGYMLGLQRQYGNRFVQQIVNLSRQDEGEASMRADAIIQMARVGQVLDSGVRSPKKLGLKTNFSDTLPLGNHSIHKPDSTPRAISQQEHQITQRQIKPEGTKGKPPQAKFQDDQVQRQAKVKNEDECSFDYMQRIRIDPKGMRLDWRLPRWPDPPEGVYLGEGTGIEVVAIPRWAQIYNRLVPQANKAMEFYESTERKFPSTRIEASIRQAGEPAIIHKEQLTAKEEKALTKITKGETYQALEASKAFREVDPTVYQLKSAYDKFLAATNAIHAQEHYLQSAKEAFREYQLNLEKHQIEVSLTEEKNKTKDIETAFSVIGGLLKGAGEFVEKNPLKGAGEIAEAIGPIAGWMVTDRQKIDELEEQLQELHKLCKQAGESKFQEKLKGIQHEITKAKKEADAAYQEFIAAKTKRAGGFETLGIAAGLVGKKRGIRTSERFRKLFEQIPYRENTVEQMVIFLNAEQPFGKFDKRLSFELCLLNRWGNEGHVHNLITAIDWYMNAKQHFNHIVELYQAQLKQIQSLVDLARGHSLQDGESSDR